MNIRQQKYKANRLAGMNQYNAARAAGYSHNYANKGGSRIEKLGKVGMKEAFEQSGITDKFLAELASQGLRATKKGQPDWFIRHKYFESVSKMTDRMKEKVEHTGKDGFPLPTPIINVYTTKNNTDSVLRSGEGMARTEQSEL